ncbi:hypothetical protein BO71DRAFT_401409 [Aspergillus ellipticus CBS 707.79]|uniref:DUF7029 domain-containing protein n=1 Tax=Aspergillus ellipticus CBS 707.79 TaxID=1448320 RepID=A0A319DJL1_9EURO|nr:hypothetical protein BO71DRAFT_401409 [Aspergillus ellipticus CBS 707.79]
MGILSKATAAGLFLGMMASATPFYPVALRRDTAASGIEPQYNVSLYYEAASSSSCAAVVNARMKVPTVVLEDISSISSVDCTTDAVEIVYSSASDYAQAVSDWSASDLVLLTNNMGSCDTVNERGVYVVSSLSTDSDSNTITAQATQSSFKEEAEFLSVVFNSTAAASKKRDVTLTLSDEWSGDLLDTDYLTIEVDDIDLSTTIDLGGGVDIDILNLKASTLYLELDLALYADLSVSAGSKGSYSADFLNYTFDALSFATVDIAGLLTIDPALTFGVGVEFSVSGEANLTADVSAQIADGKVYLDLLDSSETSTSGWAPTYSASANLTAEVDAELNPAASVSLSISVDVLDGLIDASAGIEATAEVVNGFSTDGTFEVDTSTGVSFPTGTGSCTNGFWFASDFFFGVDASVTDLYSGSLYNVTVPIYDTECVSF